MGSKAGAMLRLCAMVFAAAALAGCTSSGYPGGYYPDEAYYGERYYDGPHLGGGFGYGTFYDDDDYDRYFHPARNVSCDRVRDICYDRYGPSYHATKRYLGERDANRAYKKYGDSVFLFSPRPGVSCDRRSKECSDGQWTAPERLKRAEPGNMGSIGAGPGFKDDNDRVRRIMPPRRSNDDDAVTRRISPRVEARPPRIVDNDSPDWAPPKPRALPNESDRPSFRPRLDSSDKPGNSDGCPRRGCTD